MLPHLGQQGPIKVSPSSTKLSICAHSRIYTDGQAGTAASLLPTGPPPALPSHAPLPCPRLTFLAGDAQHYLMQVTPTSSAHSSPLECCFFFFFTNC